MSAFRVLVAGSGLGGLTLAQSLRRLGIDVAVFERDSSPWERPQGYRLHLDSDALHAVGEVLPAHLQEAFAATAYRTEPFTTILRPDLSVVRRVLTDTEHDQHAWPDAAPDLGHANVDRATLRSILLSGLDDVVHYDKQLDSWSTSSGGGVIARFRDGTSAEGDVLVGADGIRSVVRRGRAPQCATVDAGLTAIYGRLPLEEVRGQLPPEAVSDIFTIAFDELKVFLGLGTVAFPTPPRDLGSLLHPAGGPAEAEDYAVCIVGGRHERFPTQAELRAADGPRLQEIAAETVAAWPGRAQELIRAGTPGSFFLVEMFTSVPCVLDAPTNTTLLGDAIHAMTPTLGRGANLAMRDGALLGRALSAVADGRTSLSDALTAYERDMLSYGFAVVREAAAVGQQRAGQNPLPDGSSTPATPSPGSPS